MNMDGLNVSEIINSTYYYGICLVFIRSAQTINKLEVRRTEVINHLVIFLQKHWRGTLQRIRYKKMIASLKIMAFYRKYKLRAYMKDLDVRFRNVRQMEDRGKSISWGSPPKSIIATVDYFKLVFRRWQAHFVLISYPKEIHPDIKLRYVSSGQENLETIKCCTRLYLIFLDVEFSIHSKANEQDGKMVIGLGIIVLMIPILPVQ